LRSTRCAFRRGSRNEHGGDGKDEGSDSELRGRGSRYTPRGRIVPERRQYMAPVSESEDEDDRHKCQLEKE